MARKNRFVRGCLVILLAGCILLATGGIFAVTHLGLSRTASGRPNVLFNIGPLHIGSPCAQLQASYPTIRCKSSYYVVLRVSKSQLWSLEIP